MRCFEIYSKYLQSISFSDGLKCIEYTMKWSTFLLRSRNMFLITDQAIDIWYNSIFQVSSFFKSYTTYELFFRKDFNQSPTVHIKFVGKIWQIATSNYFSSVINLLTMNRNDLAVWILFLVPIKGHFGWLDSWHSSL